MFSRANTIGLTLIEILIALALSILLLVICFGLCRAYDQVLQTQEDLQLIRQKKALLQAEFTPFLRQIKSSSACQTETHLDGVSLSPNYFEAHSYQTLGTLLTQVDPNTLIIEKIDLPFFQIGMQLGIGDCVHSEFFQVRQVNSKRNTVILKTNTPLQYSYQANTEIWLQNTLRYTIQPTQRNDKNHQPIMGLFRQFNNAKKMEIAERVNAFNGLLMVYQNQQVVASESKMLPVSKIAAVKLDLQLSAEYSPNQIFHEMLYVAAR